MIPADHKWVTRSLVARIRAHEIKQLDLAYPAITADDQGKFAEARRRLEAES